VCFDRNVVSFGVGGLAALLLASASGCGEVDDGFSADPPAGEEGEVAHASQALINPNNNHDYLFFLTPSIWINASGICQSRGYHLATINTVTEDTWLVQQEASFGGGAWWFGYTDQTSEGSWGWADGIANGYVNWQPGEPNNQNNEDCGLHSAFGGPTGKWNDSNCNNSFKFICENGPPDVQPTTLIYNLSNTNSATVNYAQFAVDLNFNQGLTIGTCGVAGSFGLNDTYLRLVNPNGNQVAENDDACGGRLSLLSAVGNVSPKGTYVIRGGCYQNTACGGTVAIVK